MGSLKDVPHGTRLNSAVQEAGRVWFREGGSFPSGVRPMSGSPIPEEFAPVLPKISPISGLPWVTGPSLTGCLVT
jgi:hypothetical protein